MNKKITTLQAPAAIGPYSQAIEADSYIFVSGQLPIDPTTGQFVGDDISKLTRQSLTNIRNILSEAGLTMANVVKTTVMLTDMNDFPAMNEVYAEFFSEPFPARSAFAVKALPKEGKVEIECIAKK